MSNMSICLITGCEFVDPHGPRRIHGDLHQLHDILIFNATGCEWEHTDIGAEDKAIMSPVFYEKNKVIVIPLVSAQFNLAANIYLNRNLDAQAEAQKRADALMVLDPNKHNGEVH